MAKKKKDKHAVPWINPYQLLQKMEDCDIQYGYYDFVNKQPITYKDSLFENMDYIHNHCYVLHPKEVWRFKVGTCWDCSMMEWYWCKRIPYIDPYVLFFKYDDEDSNHTILYYHDTKFDKWYIMEYAWYRYKGFYGPYSSRKELFTNYFSNIITRKVTNVNIEVDVKSLYKVSQISFELFWNTCMRDSISYEEFLKEYTKIE